MRHIPSFVCGMFLTSFHCQISTFLLGKSQFHAKMDLAWLKVVKIIDRFTSLFLLSATLFILCIGIEGIYKTPLSFHSYSYYCYLIFAGTAAFCLGISQIILNIAKKRLYYANAGLNFLILILSSTHYCFATTIGTSLISLLIYLKTSNA